MPAVFQSNVFQNNIFQGPHLNISATDQFNYFYRFNNQITALINPTVGPYLVLPSALNNLWVYDLRQGGVNTLDGYWCMVVASYPPPPPGTPVFQSNVFQHNVFQGSSNALPLDTIPELQFIVDRNLALSGGFSIVVSNISSDLLTNLQIVHGYGAYANKGLH